MLGIKDLNIFHVYVKKMECFVWFSGYKLEIPFGASSSPYFIIFIYLFLFIYFQFIYFSLSFLFESLKSLQHGKYTIHKRSTGAMKVQGSIIYIFFSKETRGQAVKKVGYTCIVQKAEGFNRRSASLCQPSSKRLRYLYFTYCSNGGYHIFTDWNQYFLSW